MPHGAPIAAAGRCATAAPRAVPVRAPSRLAGPLVARIERAPPAALEDHELLALLGIDVDDATLAGAGGLRGLLDDPDDALRAVLVSTEDRARAHALLEVHARWMAARLQRDGGVLTSPAHTRRYVEARLRGYRDEVFAMLYLDNKHRVLEFEELFRGSVSGTSVHPRVVVRRALVHNAAACIACHNHPSGSAQASSADRAITERLTAALALVEVRLLDHFIVGDGEVASFAELGLL